MSKHRIVAIALTAFALSLAPRLRAADMPSALSPAVAAVRPALVRILVAESDFSDGREGKSEAAGSGVIITPQGHIVTNHHVAGQSKRLICTLADRREVEADLVGTDPLTDISVIKLRGAAGETFPFAQWGDSSTLAVGDQVYAMGCPMALSQSITRGIVSNTELVMPDFASGYAMTLNGEDVGDLVRWIGHDATIKPGNSGGPLVSTEGRIVGINEISMGLGGAIPANVARSVAETLMRDGKVTRAWIGLNPQPRLHSSGTPNGVLIGGVLPGSPAEKAGLKAGDLLLKVAGSETSVRFAEELPAFNQLLAGLPVGKPAIFQVLRAKKNVDLSVVPSERHEAEPKPVELRPWGMCASLISPLQRIEMRRASSDGALVVSIRTGGPCGTAKPQISSGDIITEINGKPVKDVAALQAVTDAMLKPGGAAPKVLVGFERDGERLVTVVTVGEKPEEDPGVEARKAWLPMTTQVLLPDIAKALNAAGKKGFRVTRVNPNSSASRAGCKVGDLITAVDGEPLDASQPEDSDALTELIRQYKIGATVKLSVITDGKPRTVPVVLETSPLSPREMKKYRDDNFEFTVRNLAAEDRLNNQMDPSTEGVYVEEVDDGGWAALGRLGSGDVVTEIQGKPVRNVTDVSAAMTAAAAARPERVVLHVMRGVRGFYVEMPADWTPTARANATTKGTMAK